MRDSCYRKTGRDRARWAGGLLAALAVVGAAAAVRADELPPTSEPAPEEPIVTLPPTVVRGRAEDLLGAAVSASQGAVSGKDLQDLPLLRRGELVESVPGMVVTQHSGDGKANQYFLRGFNLDHGTDFAFSVDGVPVNLPSHAHGQGYSDLNFVIPELVDVIEFKKGPFYPEVGDFSGAGAANLRLVNRLPQSIANVQAGQYRYARALLAASPSVGSGTLLYAFDYTHDDGPWVLPEHANRANGLLRYHWAGADDEVAVTGIASWAPSWQATDQIPVRAVMAGLSRFGAIDQTDGGSTARAGLSFDFTHRGDGATTKLLVYGTYYRLDLFSDFTYFLDDPVNGDQFEQVDHRWVAGADLSRTWDRVWWGKRVHNRVGIQLRNDDIPDSGLNHTAARRLLQVWIDDHVEEASGGVYAQNQIQWTSWLKSDLGLRADLVAIDVDSNLAANSGSTSAGIVSPKASLILGPWKKTEIYLDAGTGYHSNDARGVTATIDPMTLAPISPVPLLVRTKGTEVGVRTSIVRRLVSTLSLWYLQSSSELTFDGDSGDTQANGPSRKYGVELATFYRPTAWLTLSADLAVTHARYLTPQPAADGGQGTYIANSIPVVFTGAAVVETPAGFFAGARVRSFSAQPLVEDGAVHQPGSTIVSALVGGRWRRFELSAEALNLLDAQVDDIAYYYQSRLPGEAAGGMPGVHFHPAEPFQLRLSLSARF